MECELSRANGIAKWYKDGENIVENERFYFEEEGTFRSLVIMNAELTDSGKYVCDVRDDKIVFRVTVKGILVHCTVESASTLQLFGKCWTSQSL